MQFNVEQLIRLSPVPVEFVGEMQCPGYAGMFWSEDFSSGHPYIEILDSLENYQKIATLIHEISHAVCKANNCECYIKQQKQPELAEIHAYKFELAWLLKNKQKETLEYEIRNIPLLKNRSDHYAGAVKHIMKLKLWQKCLDYVYD